MCMRACHSFVSDANDTDDIGRDAQSPDSARGGDMLTRGRLFVSIGSAGVVSSAVWSLFRLRCKSEERIG